MQRVVAVPLARSPAGIKQDAIESAVDAGMMPKHLSFPGFTVIIAKDNHTVTPGVVHHKGQAVVVGGFHPITAVGFPCKAIFRGHKGKDNVLLVPALPAVGRAVVVDHIIAVTCGNDVDDVAIGTGRHHIRPSGVISWVKVTDSRNVIGTHVVFVLNDIDAALRSSVGCHHYRSVHNGQWSQIPSFRFRCVRRAESMFR